MPILEKKVVAPIYVVSNDILEPLRKGNFEVIEETVSGGGRYISNGAILYDSPVQEITLETDKHYITITKR